MNPVVSPPPRLRSILESHALYRRTRGCYGARAELPGADLSRMDLARAVLGGHSLPGAKVRRSRYRPFNYNLDRATGLYALEPQSAEHPRPWTPLPGANLAGADLTDANLAAADLFQADLAGAKLVGSSLPRAHLGRATLRGAKLSGANLSRADLSDADLTDADLSEADLTGANLSGAKLARARLRGAVLRGANLTRAQLDCADLAEADLDRARLAQASLADVDGRRTVFDGVRFRSRPGLDDLYGFADYWLSRMCNWSIARKAGSPGVLAGAFGLLLLLVPLSAVAFYAVTGAESSDRHTLGVWPLALGAVLAVALGRLLFRLAAPRLIREASLRSAVSAAQQWWAGQQTIDPAMLELAMHWMHDLASARPFDRHPNLARQNGRTVWVPGRLDYFRQLPEAFGEGPTSHAGDSRLPYDRERVATAIEELTRADYEHETYRRRWAAGVVLALYATAAILAAVLLWLLTLGFVFN